MLTRVSIARRLIPIFHFDFFNIFFQNPTLEMSLHEQRDGILETQVTWADLERHLQ